MVRGECVRLFLLVIGECYECESWNVRKLLITTCVPRQDSGQSVHPYSLIKFSLDAVTESSLGSLAMNYIFPYCVSCVHGC